MKEKKVYYFWISSHLFLLRARWNFLISRSWLRRQNLFALPNTKLFYFRARVHHFCWLLIFDSFLTHTEKLKRIQTTQKSFCKILLAVLRASKRPEISAPLHNSLLYFHLHNCSLKIIDDGLTPNACLFPPTQTKRLNTIIIIPKRKTRKKATRRTTADGFAEGEEVNIACITGALWTKRGEHGITREAQDGGERARYAE